jgi:hypothetical protein
MPGGRICLDKGLLAAVSEGCPLEVAGEADAEGFC